MRNMITCNINAFENLTQQVLQKIDLIIEPGRRYIESNELEKKWIKEAKFLELLIITPNIRAHLVDFDNVRYVVIIGSELEDSNIDKDILNKEELNAGLITILISEDFLKLHRRVDVYKFYNDILFQHQDKDYKGHNYKELLEFTESISVFSIPDYSILKNGDISRILCYIFSNNSEYLIINFDNKVLEFTSDLSLVGSDNISYNILLSYLFSTTFKHAFLEIYRLIERLFPINYLKEFHKLVNTNLSFVQFTSSLEGLTGWRPKEDEAIEKMFSKNTSSTKAQFTNFISTLTVASPPNDYKYFYNLRNSIVHFRANHQEYILSNQQWNLLILATLNLLDEQYSMNSEIL